MFLRKNKFKQYAVSGGSVARVIVSLVLILLAACLIYNRQLVYDEAVYLFFKPSQAISNIEDQIDLTDSGKFLFYASQPKVDSASQFNSDCNKTETTTSVLGCYANNRIFIYDVSEPRLDGVKQVTAAHEMLHAAYARLSNQERTRVDKLIEAEYATLKNDDNFKALTKYYNKTEPGELDNELHSIIGTQVSSISPELESYYAKYFVNRKAVVSLYQQYFGVFQSLNQQASNLSDQITALKSTIETETGTYNSNVATLKSDIDNFNSRANSGQFTSQGEFSIERSALVSRQEALESTREQINDDISTYNSLISQYNSIASQSQKLQNSLNSSLSSSPQL